MLVFYLALAGSSWLGGTTWWQSRFARPQESFTLAFLGAYLRDLGVAFAVIAGLWLIKRNRREFFLVKGQLDAPIEPVRWLGVRQGESWRTFGWIFAFAAGLGVSIPTILAMQPSTEALVQALPLLPAALLFAAINAFTEETYYRASLLSTLQQPIGRFHALGINVVFFGLGHYLYGSPPGMIGFAMTGFLAFLLLGKSMLETKGFFWAWFIHFVPDVVIFISYAMLWVQI
jgi:membrane protease YdiL (CAAX protease family)